ncbi:hypothetical protein GGX14DRAFT_667341 [Mycena pura]|uniref:Uncharacterized protein n=1 Tax=Mycena pura TaxID=153505 RepID=A0AAD6UZ62_9AGAR|nr:hypothetical protein GGX14DRAFT_667341 [Mycena pura]
MAFEGVSSKPEVDQYALGLIGKLRTGVAAAFGTVARISSLLVALRRMTVPQWSAGFTPGAYGESAASEPPPKARHACRLHMHSPAYGVASTGVQHDVPRAAGRVHRGAGGMSWSGVCGGHGVRDGACEVPAGVSGVASGCSQQDTASMAEQRHAWRGAECVVCAAAGVKKKNKAAWRTGARSKTLRAACIVCRVHGSGCKWRAGAGSRKLRPWGAACEVWAAWQHKAAPVAGQGVRGGVPRHWRLRRAWRGAACVACAALHGGGCERCGGCSRQNAVCVAGQGVHGGAAWVRARRAGACTEGMRRGVPCGQGRACGLLCAARREVQGVRQACTVMQRDGLECARREVRHRRTGAPQGVRGGRRERVAAGECEECVKIRYNPEQCERRARAHARRGMHVQHARRQAAGVYGGCVCSTQRRQSVQQGTYDVRLGEWWAAAQRMPRRARRAPRPGPASVAYVRRRRGRRGARVWLVARHAVGSSIRYARTAAGSSAAPAPPFIRHLPVHACTAAGHAYDVRRVRRGTRTMVGAATASSAAHAPTYGDEHARMYGVCMVAHAYDERRGACDARGGWASMRAGQAQVYGVQRGEQRLPAQRTSGHAAGDTPRSACDVAGPAYVCSGGAHAYGAAGQVEASSAAQMYGVRRGCGGS